jgi:hypothetical protein
MDLTGERFGAWLVLEFGHRNCDGQSYFKCQCDCGVVREVRTSCLIHGRSSHCGCKMIKHGEGVRRTVEYETWHSMKSRCYNKNNISYPNYGGRGITVCDRWKDNYKAFLHDMGRRPENTSLDRIDSNGPYSPENCRWASIFEQINNRSTTIMIDYKGKLMPLADAIRLSGLKSETVRSRRRNGFPLEQWFELDKLPSRS